MNRGPDIIDDDQYPERIEPSCQGRRSAIKVGVTGTLSEEHLDQVLEACGQIFRRLAEGHPEDAVPEGLLDPWVKADGPGQSGLAVSTGATKSGGQTNRQQGISSDESRDHGLDETWSLDEVDGRVLRHKGRRQSCA